MSEKEPRTKSVDHIVRTADGKFQKFKMSRKFAMQCLCQECMGFTNPSDCTSYFCPIYPFRRGTHKTSVGSMTENEARAAIL